MQQIKSRFSSVRKHFVVRRPLVNCLCFSSMMVFPLYCCWYWTAERLLGRSAASYCKTTRLLPEEKRFCLQNKGSKRASESAQHWVCFGLLFRTSLWHHAADTPVYISIYSIEQNLGQIQAKVVYQLNCKDFYLEVATGTHMFCSG